jgi:hypothetical protein
MNFLLMLACSLFLGFAGRALSGFLRWLVVLSLIALIVHEPDFAAKCTDLFCQAIQPSIPTLARAWF